MNSYAYIVVGAGSAGVALAARLSERQTGRVLLIEAGDSRERDFWVRAPIGIAKVVGDPRYVWQFRTSEQSSLVNQTVYWPRGRMLGGSSGVNGTIFVRGEAEEFDYWESLGNAGWGYQGVLPYFQRFEKTDLGSDAFRGRNGPVTISSLAKMPDPLSDAFRDACVAAGIPLNPDYNGETSLGVSYLQLNTRNGQRCDVATAYLHGRKRENLDVMTNAIVTRVLLKNHQAYGVEIFRDGSRVTATADAEVILAAGPVKSPQLLELSGIGQAARLAAMGIEVKLDSPGVGENLTDHAQTRISFESTREVGLNRILKNSFKTILMGLQYISMRRGHMATPAFTIHALARTERDEMLGRRRPSVKIQLAQLSGNTRFEMTTGGTPGAMLDNYSGFSIGCFQLRPTSRGFIHAISPDPMAEPVIDPKYLSTEEDCLDVVASVKLARKVAAQRPLSDFILRETRPSADIMNDQGLLEYIKKSAATSFHPVGTCKMGVDEMAVVDPRLCVHGVDRLRVADSSVMPTIPASNTNAASIMIGEKAADLILAGH